jgi:hypothetical protein
MISIFWISTLFLGVIAQAFFLPWVKQPALRVMMMTVFLGSAYGLYFYWGSSTFLPQYYSEKETAFRKRQPELRILLTEFKKEEYRLRLRLEENPNDKEVLKQLTELLKIKALF